jgi:hypothetical protein|tara:strand:+ start:596 stop:805 length:210 start_codon:yes stop_codon:yes gene_type:complete
VVVAEVAVETLVHLQIQVVVEDQEVVVLEEILQVDPAVQEKLELLILVVVQVVVITLMLLVEQVDQESY